MLFINLEQAKFHKGNVDNFYVKIAEAPQEINGLFEVGFEFVSEKDQSYSLESEQMELKNLKVRGKL